MNEAKGSSYSSRWQLSVVAFGLLIAALLNGRVVAHQLMQRQPTSVRLHQSLTEMPLDTAPYVRLAELNPTEEKEYLKAAIQRNPWDTVDSLRLSADLELAGDLGSAERILQTAVVHDRGLGPRWALANFYLRSGNKDAVFEIINTYRNVNPQPNASLLRLSIDSAASLDEAMSKLSNLSCGELSAMLVLADDRNMSSGELVERESKCGDSDSRHTFALHISHLLADDHPEEAKRQWEHIGLKDSLFNDNFINPISEDGFDWRENRSPGIKVAQSPAVAGIEFRISPEAIAGTVLIFQPIVLEPNARYQFRATVSDQDIATTNLRAELVEMTTGRVISSGLNLSRDWEKGVGSWNFIAPASPRTTALAFVYFRPDGGVATEKQIQVNSADLKSYRNSSNAPDIGY